jgi:hypothetical protein
VKGRPRREVVLFRIDRETRGRYSVRQPVESSGASAAERARPTRGLVSNSASRMGKRLFIFAIYSPFSSLRLPFPTVKIYFSDVKLRRIA